MSLFFKASDKEILDVRNKIFLEKGVLALKECGFSKSPFENSWFGRNNLGDYSYQFCRMSRNSNLEIVIVHISKGDSWIKIFLNIFTLHPVVNSIEQLYRVNGIQFLLPPNSATKMRLRIDNISVPPLFSLFGDQHKIGSYLSKSGLVARIQELGELIYHDLKNIDYYIKCWHEIHNTLQVKWNGEKIDA